MKKLMVALALLCGCKDQHGQDTDCDDCDPCKANGPVAYLCVGMETSKRFGACPGCKLDAVRMNAMFRDQYGYKGDVLISDEATKSAVVSKLRSGIDGTPENGLFLFCYSGHGGQEYLGGKEPDGADRQDEYLCLYDTYMLDDEIWDIVSKCRGRVFLYFDACHSATMYRSVRSDLAVSNGVAVALGANDLVKSKGFSFDVSNRAAASAMSLGKREASGGIMCWSGCKEAEYSYGGNAGGVMTSVLVKSWRQGITYERLWSLVVKGVRKEQPTQNPVQTHIGSGFSDSAEAFR